MTDSERINRINKIIYDRLTSLNNVLSGGGPDNKFEYVRYPQKCLNAFVEKYNIGQFNLDNKKRTDTRLHLPGVQNPDHLKKCLTFEKNIPYGDLAAIAAQNCEIKKCDPTAHQIGGNIQMSPEFANYINQNMKSNDSLIKNWEVLDGILNTSVINLSKKGIVLDSSDINQIKSMIAEYKKIILKKMSLEKYVNVIEEIRKEFSDSELSGTSLNQANLEKIAEEYSELYENESKKINLIMKLLSKMLEL
jgi:hypothetical protein